MLGAGGRALSPLGKTSAQSGLRGAVCGHLLPRCGLSWTAKASVQKGKLLEEAEATATETTPSFRGTLRRAQGILMSTRLETGARQRTVT